MQLELHQQEVKNPLSSSSDEYSTQKVARSFFDLRDFSKEGKYVPQAIVEMNLDPRILKALQEVPEFVTPDGGGADSAAAAAKNDDDDDDDDVPTLQPPYTQEEYLALGYYGPLCDGEHMSHLASGEHVYYEGYLHASAPHGEAPIESMNPRSSTKMDKPAAPVPLRAFLAAFKEANATWLKPLLAEMNLEFITEETAFADIAAQSHYGGHVEIHPDKAAGWHFDAPNSLLHLAITLHGERFVHYVRHEDKNRPRKAEASSTGSSKGLFERDLVDFRTRRKDQSKAEDGGAPPAPTTMDVEVYDKNKMVPGNVYLTSPSAFMHAVEYPLCDFYNRVLALQCRTLVPDRSVYGTLASREKEGGHPSPAELVGKALRSSKNQIRLPTFEEFEVHLNKLNAV